MKFIKDKHKVLHVERKNPLNQYRLGIDCLASSSGGSDWGTLVNRKVNMRHQCAPATEQSCCLCAAFKASQPIDQANNCFPSPQHLLEHIWNNKPSFTYHSGRTMLIKLECTQWRATKTAKVWVKDVLCEDKLREVSLFSLEKNVGLKNLIISPPVLLWRLSKESWKLSWNNLW